MNFAIFASGPSLQPADVDLFRGWATIAVNSTFRMAPWATFLYACDVAWWDDNVKDVRKAFQGSCWTQSGEAAKKYGLNYIRSERKPGLGRLSIHQGANSGYQAINLAYLWGARRIVLLGFDHGKRRGQKHWHEPHRGNADHPYDLWIQNMDQLAFDLAAEGVEVLNASRRTSLHQFPLVDARDVAERYNFQRCG